jgi:hypothetical protein
MSASRVVWCLVLYYTLDTLDALVTINEKLSVLLETRENCARRESDTG